ncbi:MAG: sulfite exporter TauE/SafE family protein [Chitinophagales bacterium]
MASLELFDLFLLFLGGLLAGIINTLAGNGSAITLSLLFFFGLSAHAANATNRVGVFLQTIVAVLSLRKNEQTKKLFWEGAWFLIPSFIGSVLGAVVAIDIDEHILTITIGVLMLLILASMFFSPKRWAAATSDKKKKTPLNFVLFFALGFYAGFVQMGMGLIFLSIMILVAQYSLKDANIIKQFLVLALVAPAFFVFAFSGQIDWVLGLAIAPGQMLGAFIASRYLLQNDAAQVWIRYLLMVILIVAAVKLLGIWDWAVQVFVA